MAATSLAGLPDGTTRQRIAESADAELVGRRHGCRETCNCEVGEDRGISTRAGAYLKQLVSSYKPRHTSHSRSLRHSSVFCFVPAF